MTIQQELKRIADEMLLQAQPIFEAARSLDRRALALRLHIKNCSRSVGFDDGCSECGGAQAIEARQRRDREAGHGPEDESAVAESDAPKTHRQDTPSPPEDM
jgi:hypothetical protein